ncbi:hypothetical protein PINS_up009485 [Pythium insidiosum]|nr:hypothetical protein PINS_up009485 [Pythium insidiosum]
MTQRSIAVAAYDRMLAELQADSDDDDEQATSAVRAHDRKALSTSASASTPRFSMSAKGTAKPRPFTVRDGGSRSTQNTKSSLATDAKPTIHRHDAKTNDSEAKPTQEIAAETTRHRRSSFPPVSSRSSSRRSSKSHNSDGGEDENSGSEGSGAGGSDHEREAPVQHAASDAFGSGSAPPFPASTRLHTEPSALRSFLVKAPRAGSATIKCVVRRDRHGLNRLHPVYRLFLEDGDRFLLSAQKRSTSKTSNYLLTMEPQPSDRRSALIVGKLRANWSGSEYVVFDDGLSPHSTALDVNVRAVLALIEFAYDEMGPGRINVRVPPVHDSGASALTWRDPELDKASAAREAFAALVDRRALLLRNVRPRYDARTGSHMLDFHGRVSMPSVKNFQLETEVRPRHLVIALPLVRHIPDGPHTHRASRWCCSLAACRASRRVRRRSASATRTRS